MEKTLDFKKIIEEQLGYEINTYDIEPVYDKGKWVGISVRVEPKRGVQYIDLNFTILKTGAILEDNGGFK